VSEPEENPHAASVRKLAAAMLRTAWLPTLIAVAACAVLAVSIVGLPGLWGALVGGAIGIGISVLTIVLMRLSAELPPMVVMAVAMAGYVAKLLVLLVVIVTLKGVGDLHPYALGLTMLASLFVWIAAEVVAFRRTDIPTIIAD
jgi:ATP synthase protein I